MIILGIILTLVGGGALTLGILQTSNYRLAHDLYNFYEETGINLLKDAMILMGSILLFLGVIFLIAGIVLHAKRSKTAVPQYVYNPYIPNEPTVPPVVEEPVAEEPVAEEPVAEEPVAEEPVVEETVAEEPAVEEPAVEELVVEEPVVEEPVAEVTENFDDEKTIAIFETPEKAEPAVEAEEKPVAENKPVKLFCTECGHKLNENAVFCANCGKKIY